MKINSGSLRISFCIVVAGLAALCSGCAKQEIKNTHSLGTSVVCFGDSLTRGYGVEPPEDYPSVLRAMVSLPVINAGVNSQTSLQGLKRIEKDVLAHQPALVIVAFGGNDFLTKVPKEQTRQALNTMVDRIQAAGSMVALVDISAGFLFQEYQPLLRRIAQEKGALFIPNVFHNVVNNPALKSDFIHPNAQGYALVARRIHAAVAPFLAAHKPAGVTLPRNTP